METCRTCGEYVNKTSATNLFEDSKRILVHQIEVLTGLWLEIQENMSNFICSHCQRDLNQAVEFRERCITTQMALQEQQQQTPQQTNEAKNEEQDNDDDDDNGSLVSVSKLAFDDIDVDSIQLALHFNDSFALMTPRDESKRNDNVGSLDDEPGQGDNIFSNENILAENITEEKVVDIIDNNANNEKQENRKDLKRTYKKRKKWQKDRVCEQCGKTFSNASNFKLHMLRHLGKKNYQCRVCGDLFYTRHFLRRHKRKHTDERPFPCNYCDRKFRTWSNRIDHERSHTNERPYQCSHCEKSFYTCSIRKEHELVHTGVRKFCCNICNQWFLRRTHLVTHCRSKIHKLRELQQPQPELQVDVNGGI